jgi:hypothetical protein
MLNAQIQPWTLCPPPLWLCNILNSLPVIFGQVLIRMSLYMHIKHFWSKIKKIAFSDMQGVPECKLLFSPLNKGER